MILAELRPLRRLRVWTGRRWSPGQPIRREDPDVASCRRACVWVVRWMIVTVIRGANREVDS